MTNVQSIFKLKQFIGNMGGTKMESPFILKFRSVNLLKLCLASMGFPRKKEGGT